MQHAIASPDIEEARLSGFETGRTGGSFRLCPFAPLTAERSAWLDGYRLAINPNVPAHPAGRPSLNFRTELW